MTPPRPKRLEMVLQVINKTMLTNWFKSYCVSDELVDFSLLVELHREGSAPAACAAGLLHRKKYDKMIKVAQ